MKKLKKRRRQKGEDSKYDNNGNKNNVFVQAYNLKHFIINTIYNEKETIKESSNDPTNMIQCDRSGLVEDRRLSFFVIL